MAVKLDKKWSDIQVNWAFPWDENKTYPINTMTRIGEWTSISNTETSAYPVPIEVGNPEFYMENAVFTSASQSAIVECGHTFTFSSAGYFSQVRVQVPTVSSTITYRFIAEDITDPQNPIRESILNPLLVAGQWNTIIFNKILINIGSVIRVFIQQYDSGSTVDVTGGWQYGGTANSTPPPERFWNTNVQQDLLRIDTVDLDSVDRKTELLGIGSGSLIQFNETATPENLKYFRTNADPIDRTDYIEYPDVTLVDTNGTIPNNNITTMNAETPVTQSTDYYIDIDFWLNNDPQYADVSGFLKFSGVDQPGNDNNGFGIDVRFQKIEQDTEWDVLAFSS